MAAPPSPGAALPTAELRGPMRILLAPDSFKGSLSAPAVCDALTAGLRRVLPDAEIVTIPLADGGEGFAEALLAARGGRWQELDVTGPLPAERPRVPGRPAWAGWMDRRPCWRWPVPPVCRW